MNAHRSFLVGTARPESRCGGGRVCSAGLRAVCWRVGASAPEGSARAPQRSHTMVLVANTYDEDCYRVDGRIARGSNRKVSWKEAVIAIKGVI